MNRRAAALLSVLLAACTGAPGDDTAGAPSLTLLSPADGDVVCGDPLHVVTAVENFRLTNDTVEDPPPDLGHLHVYLNGQEVAQSDVETIDVSGVADGEWQLSLDISHADHSALDPYVGVFIYITVDHTLCPE